MNRSELAALPAVVDVPTAADALGLSRNLAYELVRTGEWPTPVLRLGKLIKIPTAPILELLGITQDARPIAVQAPSSTRHAS
jgi:predicted DNA-binding transcriptional regulator AlpA